MDATDTSEVTRLARRLVLPTLLLTSVAAIITFPILAATRVKSTPSMLPSVGYVVADEVGRHLPAGGTLLVVSETCEICVDRAPAYVKTVANHSDQVLFVTGTHESEVFEPLLVAYPGARERVLFVNPRDMVRYSQVRVVPTAVVIDEDGTVRHADASNIGWARAAFNPRRWIRSWRRVVVNGVESAPEAQDGIREDATG